MIRGQAIPVIRIGNLLSYDGAVGSTDAVNPSAAAETLGKTSNLGDAYMSGHRALRVVAFMSISVGVGILSHAAWGFVIFGILVLIDNFVFKSDPPAPLDRVVDEEEVVKR